MQLIPEVSAPREPDSSQLPLGLELHERLNSLHETLYTRGGVRPVNAAIEELSKIVLLQMKHARDPDWKPQGAATIAEILDPDRLSAEGGADALKAAFSAAIRLPEFSASLPDGTRQPIWPLDEPFRLTQSDVLAEALSLIEPNLLRRVEQSEDYDLLGTAFDALLRGRYDHAGGMATYLTPHNVAQLLAQMCLADLEVPTNWRPGSALFGDPCCGTGRFLVAGVREARRMAEQWSDHNQAARFMDGFAGSGLVGADQSASSVAKARLNLILFGLEHPTVFAVQDSITDPLLDSWRGSMRLILTNPPFGDRKYDNPQGVARTTKTLRRLGKRAAVDPGLAFVVRCLDLLDDGGRLGIILPDGLVDGSALRAALMSTDVSFRLRDVSLEANISLPTATFALSGTVARTSAVVLRKGGARRTSVLLARAEHCGYIKQGQRAIPDPAGDDLPAIGRHAIRAWSQQDSPLPQGIRVLSENPAVTLIEREGLTTADPSRVDPAALSAKHELLASGGVQLHQFLRSVRSKAVRGDGSLPFVSVLHIDELGAVSWLHARGYTPTTPGVRAQTGQLLLSMLNPRKLRATVVPDDIPDVLCSSEFGVFDADDPWAVLVLLNDPRVRQQLAPLGRGTSSSRRRIDNTDLFGVVVPPLDDQIHARGSALKKAHAIQRRGTEAIVAALGLNQTS
jgi:hypothetical protein